MQKHVNLVDLVKSFPTNIFLQIWRRYRRERALQSLRIWLKNPRKVRYRTFQLSLKLVVLLFERPNRWPKWRTCRDKRPFVVQLFFRFRRRFEEELPERAVFPRFVRRSARRAADVAVLRGGKPKDTSE